ncbi:MAG: hypothetical protein JNM70_16135 [Anaerolineae bacterium]|nr:hypothetical protein [Anaerolineae bacterium]
MIETTLEQQILELVSRLGTEQQQQVLQYVREMAVPRGVPAVKVFEAARGLFDPQDIDEMARAIEEDCEKIGYSS